MSTIALSLDAGTQIYREWGQPNESKPAIVLLHGISSGSGSWAPLAEALTDDHLLAWDAPGYGSSRMTHSAEPLAADYAHRLESWLASIKLDDCVLVGHSLGALMATAYASRYPGRVRGVVLADPAQGYRYAGAEERARVYQSRWPELERLGPEDYAHRRAPRLLRPGATAQCVACVRQQIQCLNVEGFRRANWMLANDALSDYLPLPEEISGLVICGAEDMITPPEDARELAERLGWGYRELPDAGHVSYIDNPEDFATVLRQFMCPADSGQLVT